METLSVATSSGEAEASPDPSWRGLYRAGGVSATLFVILIIVPIVLLFTTPPPSSGGAATFQYIASHKLVYIIELASFVGLSVPANVVFLALYVALKHLKQGGWKQSATW